MNYLDNELEQNFEQEEKSDDYYYSFPVKLKATLQRINFPKTEIKPDYGFFIIRLNPIQIIDGELHPHSKDWTGAISVKGNMSRLEAGEEYELTLKLLEVDPKYGATYKLLYKKSNFNFKDISQQKIFFDSFLTEKQIANIFETFENPIDILESGDIESLCQVKGIGYTTAEKILERYEGIKDYAQAYIELAEYDLTTDAIRKLCDRYGSPEALVNIIKTNPYILVDAEGYGFKKADNIALSGGLDKNSIDRVMAFIEHTLKEKGQNGYSWIESSELIYEIEEKLDGLEMDTVLEAVNTLKEQGKVWNGEFGKIGSMKLYRLEEKIVDELFRLMNAEKREIPEGWEDRVKLAEKLQGWEYTSEQKDAIKTILENNVCIVTGWGGTGKSSTVLGALKALGDVSFGQCALSGKASSRLEDVTGYKSFTIHRLLGFMEGQFTYNKDNPMEHDVIVLDEASMVSGDLFYSLIQAVKTGNRLIMMGDINQIPPLTSLNVFYDCLMSGVIPSVRLTEIHRQAKRSAIITNSIQLSKGIQLVEKDFEGKETRGELQDLHLDIYDKSWKTFDKVIETFKEKLAIVKDVDKIQVIVPFNLSGEVSCYNLNKKLQEICNPVNSNKKEIEISYGKDKKAILREGDRIINTLNNYGLQAIVEDGVGMEQIPVFNGFVGSIEKICRNGNLEIYFPILDRRVIIPKSHWEEKKAIQHSYCISCHKAQGSQFECVIVAIDSTHYVMLNSEWLYTAISRSEKDCTLIAQRHALNTAIRKKHSKERQTFLIDLIHNKLNKHID